MLSLLASIILEAGVGQRREKRSRGAITVEYVMILGIITVGIFAFFAPRSDSEAFTFYNMLRDGYRRAIVFISVPLL